MNAAIALVRAPIARTHLRIVAVAFGIVGLSEVPALAVPQACEPFSLQGPPVIVPHGRLLKMSRSCGRNRPLAVRFRDPAADSWEA